MESQVKPQNAPQPLNWFSPAYLSAQTNLWRDAANSSKTSKLAVIPKTMLADFYAGATRGQKWCSHVTQPLVGPAFCEPTPTAPASYYAKFCAQGGAVGFTKKWLPGPVSYLVGSVPGVGMGLVTAFPVAGTNHIAELKKLIASKDDATSTWQLFCAGALIGFMGTVGCCRAATAALLSVVHGFGRGAANVLQFSAALTAGVVMGLYGVGHGIYNSAAAPHPLVPREQHAVVDEDDAEDYEMAR